MERQGRLEPGAWALGCLSPPLSRLPSTLGVGSLRTAGGGGEEGVQETKGTCPEGLFQPQPLTVAVSAAVTVFSSLQTRAEQAHGI